MASTHLSLHFHVVFSTKNRAPAIAEAWRARLHAYIGGVVRSLGGVPVATGGSADHVHLLLDLRSDSRLSFVVRDVKCVSSRWVHQEVGDGSFAWQEGYGAFSVSASKRENVRGYVLRQEEHLRARGFEEEYLELLRSSGVKYDERYLW